MLRYYGITELTGSPGTGRTAIAVEESKKYRTVYITTTTFSIQRYRGSAREVTDRILIRYLGDIEALSAFIMSELEAVIAEWGIELFIVDSLDHLLCTEERYPHRRVSTMVNKLKSLNGRYGTRMLIITCHYGGWSIGDLCIPNPRLGLSWMYAVNTRYVCTRESGTRTLSLVHSPVDDESQLEYKIEAERVLLL
jgi:hypothetical protein